MFMLGRILAQGDRGRHGCALAFGPGLTAEAMRFRQVGAAA
jgi:alpha-pyrone synthase